MTDFESGDNLNVVDALKNSKDYRQVAALIDRIKGQKKRIVIAIDGRCGSGKTTIAKTLADEYHATLFHMDDFFLRAEQRTPERLATPGGNVDYERFISEIMTGIAGKETVMLRRFNHSTFQPGEAEEVAIRDVVIVEGTYSCHPQLREFYDLKIFVTTEYETQLERILKRSGRERYEMFVAKWIPMEELYFNGMNTEDCCDYVIRT